MTHTYGTPIARKSAILASTRENRSSGERTSIQSTGGSVIIPPLGRLRMQHTSGIRIRRGAACTRTSTKVRMRNRSELRSRYTAIAAATRRARIPRNFFPQHDRRRNRNRDGKSCAGILRAKRRRSLQLHHLSYARPNVRSKKSRVCWRIRLSTASRLPSRSAGGIQRCTSSVNTASRARFVGSRPSAWPVAMRRP